MVSAIRSLRSSLRVLIKHWMLSAIAVFSLSIAMALGVLSLSISNTFLVLSPAAPEPDRLVMIYSRGDSADIDQISYADYKYLRAHNHVFTDIAAAPNSIGLTADSDDGKTEKFVNRPVSDNYFAVLGIRPWLGRFFAPGEDSPAKPIAVMTWHCWKRLGSDPKIIGKSVGGSTIIGIAPREFTGSFYGLNGDLLVSLGRDANSDRHDPRQFFLLARLRPGVSKQKAQAELTALSSQLAANNPTQDAHRTVILTRATLLPPDGIQPALLATGILLAVVLLVLLIACANVANLLLAIAVGRRQETSIKLALGAPRARLIREFLRESALLCIVGGAIGYAVAAAIIVRFSDFTYSIPIYGAISFGLNLRLDGTVAAFTAALILIAILATGVAPALYTSSPNVAQVLSGEIVVGGTRRNLRRSLLVIAQVAVCTLVLIGMGLCQRSLYNLRHVDPGFSARNLIATTLYPKTMGYTDLRAREFNANVRTRIAALPGVESVTLAADLPLLGGRNGQAELPAGGKKIPVSHTIVDTNYFTTLGIRILEGRVFDSRDREGSPAAAVINRRMADMLWPGEDPLGKQIEADDPPRPLTVIGIVANGRYEDLDEEPQPFMYYALAQNDQPEINVIARTHGDPKLWSDPISGVLRGQGLPFFWTPVTLENWMNLTLFQERAVAAAVAGLSALGLLLAVIGLFGAISYSVSERKKELGIRVALGARPPQLLTMVLCQTARISGVGIALGILLGIGVTAAVRSELYNIANVEWTVLLAVGAGMLLVSLLVAWLSARPWLRVSPMEAVRHA